MRLVVPLPFGLDVAPGSRPVCGGTVTTTSAPDAPGSYPTPAPAGGRIDLEDAAVSPGSSCQFSVPVTAADADPYMITAYTQLPMGQSAAPVAGTSLTVDPTAQAPEVTAAFSPRIVPFGPESSLTLTITNPNAIPLTGLWFYYETYDMWSQAATSTYSQAAKPPVPERVAANTCGGQAFAFDHDGVVLPPAMGLGDGVVPPSGRCQVTFVMSTFAPGLTTLAVTVHSAQGGSGVATAAITRVKPRPLVAMRFSPDRLKLGATGRLRITVTNQSVTGLAGLAFRDALPPGLRVARPVKASNTCDGHLRARSRSRVVSLSNGRLRGRTWKSPPNLNPPSHCALTVNVRAVAAGSFRDSTGRVTVTNGSNGRPAAAHVTILPKRRGRGRM